MSANFEKAIITSLGPFPTHPVIFAGTVSTSPVKVGLTTAAVDAQARRLKVLNGSASARLAWKTVNLGAAAPTFNANFGADAGVILLSGQVEYINLHPGFDFYIVASAAATEYCIVEILR